MMKRIAIVLALSLVAISVVVSGAASQAPGDAQTTEQWFYVIGFVKSPGKYRFDGSVTVQEGIAIAGGLTERASPNGMRIRRTVDGVPTDLEAKLTDAVQHDDTIVVRQRLQ